MKRKAQVDLTVGPMSRHYRTLAIPAALGMVFSTLYNMVDIFYAGRLATQAQAGLAIGFMVFFIFALSAMAWALPSAPWSETRWGPGTGAARGA
jgi:Na+-driven multidrug efflux pump